MTPNPNVKILQRKLKTLLLHLDDVLPFVLSQNVCHRREGIKP